LREKPPPPPLGLGFPTGNSPWLQRKPTEGAGSTGVTVNFSSSVFFARSNAGPVQGLARRLKIADASRAFALWPRHSRSLSTPKQQQHIFRTVRKTLSLNKWGRACGAAGAPDPGHRDGARAGTGTLVVGRNWPPSMLNMNGRRPIVPILVGPAKLRTHPEKKRRWTPPKLGLLPRTLFLSTRFVPVRSPAPALRAKTAKTLLKPGGPSN